MAVAEHNVPQEVLIRGVDFVNQEVINNSFVQVAAVEHNVHQVVFIREADSAKQDNKYQNITHNKINNYSTNDQTLTSSKVYFLQSIFSNLN